MHTMNTTRQPQHVSTRDLLTNIPSIHGQNTSNAFQNDQDMPRRSSTRNHAHTSGRNHAKASTMATQSQGYKETLQGSSLRHRRGFDMSPLVCPSEVPARASLSSTSTSDLAYILNNNNAHPVVVIQHFYQTPRGNAVPARSTDRTR